MGFHSREEIVGCEAVLVIRDIATHGSNWIAFAGGDSGAVYYSNATIRFGVYPSSTAATYQCRLEAFSDNGGTWNVQQPFAACTSPKVPHAVVTCLMNPISACTQKPWRPQLLKCALQRVIRTRSSATQLWI